MKYRDKGKKGREKQEPRPISYVGKNKPWKEEEGEKHRLSPCHKKDEKEYSDAKTWRKGGKGKRPSIFFIPWSWGGKGDQSPSASISITKGIGFPTKERRKKALSHT